jgi:hypothetical protein
MRSAAVTLLVAAAVPGGVLVAGWSLQAAALPRPERGDTAAIRAMELLSRYRYVESTVRLDGAPAIRGRCLEGWFARRGGGSIQGTLLQLDDGRRLVVTRGHPAEKRALATMLLAGCPRELAAEVDQLVQSGDATHTHRAWAAGQPALAVRISTRRDGELTLYLAPQSDVPLALTIRGWGRGTIRPFRLTPLRIGGLEGRR